MLRDQLTRHPTATYVMPEYRAVYISTNKAACTSLKWLVADVQGEDPERFYRSISREVSRAMCIHRRSLWANTPMLHDLPDDQLAEVSPENGWFVFAVVRHPVARFFSGWQSKFLLRDPRWIHDHGDEPWIPRVPETSDELVEDFGRFALAMTADPGHAVMRDRHFLPQTAMLSPERTPYSRIYKTEELGELLGDLERHLRANGYTGDVKLRKSNETPLAPQARAFPPDVLAGLQRVYAADFETFGYDTPLPAKLDDDGEYSASVLAEIERLVERDERIGDLALRAQALRAANKKLKQPVGGRLRRWLTRR